MRKTASYRVLRLSGFCTDPEEADKKIREAIGWGVQLQKRTVRMIKLERLFRSSVGTGKVEKLALALAKETRGGRSGVVEERERMRMVRRKVLLLMRDKVRDAKEDVDLAQIQFCKAKSRMWKVIPLESRMGEEVREVMRGEMGWEWKERMKLMEKSVNYLVKKYKRMRMEEVPAMWKGIKITDQALGEKIQLPPPFLGEQVGQVSDAAKEVLQLPPKTAVFSKILIEDIQMEVNKAVDVKARWTDVEMKEREESGQSREEAEEEERQETEVYNRVEGTLNLANMRVTDLTTNKEVFLPDERPDDVEVGLQAFSAEMMEISRKYIREKVDAKGNVKECNLNDLQQAGLKDIQKLVKDGHIVTKTDKSGRQCLLTENEYIQIGEQHVERDEVKTRKETEQNEDNLNAHSLQFCRLLGLCDGQNCARRLKSAILNQNTLPPSLYFTIKDHKTWTPGDTLPARPVCGAVKAHNGQLGFMITQVIDAVSDLLVREQGTESDGTPDTLAAIKEDINCNDDVKDLVFFSTDVKSLYPSLQGEQCAAIVARMVRESSLKVEGVNWDQAALYLALTLTRERVEELQLQEVIPIWKKAGGRGRHPGITTKEVKAPLQENKDWGKSLFNPPSRGATVEEKKLILSLCVEQGLLAAMDGHLYNWHLEVKKQVEGLGIGSDLTRAVARLVLLDWDNRFINLVQENKLSLYSYTRFVDDTANGMAALPPGMRWGEEEGHMVFLPHLEEEDKEVQADMRTMTEVVRMGNSLSPMIQLTGDCPSANESGKMPLLNTQVWVEENKLMHENYRKPMANPLTMLAMSAMPAKMKRTVLTQEVVRIRRNISLELPWDTTVKHLNDFSNRMRASGYDEKYRFEIIKSGVEGFDKMVEEENNGGRPINQRRTWNKDQRQKKKELQKKNWFAKGGYDVPLFVPHTPGGELAKRMRSAEAQNHQGRKIRFKIVEKGGVTLERMLRRSNPWSQENCGRAECFPCQGGEGGTCWREGITYTLFCVECGEELAAYFGESGRNGFTRGKEHIEKYNAKDEDNSVLWLHSMHHHQGRLDVPYSMKVTGVFPEPLDRQTMERVQISTFKGPVLMNRRNEMGGVRVERMQYRRWGGNS